MNDENDDYLIVASNDSYEIRIVGTIYGESTKRSLLVEIDNKINESISFSINNLIVDDVDCMREEGGEAFVLAKTTEKFPLVFEEWIDFEHCPGEFIMTNESETINNRHAFSISVIKK